MPGIAGLMAAFVGASTVLGLLAAGIFMPLAGVGGMATKEVVTAFDALPAQFTSSPMAQQSRVLARDGSTIATLYEENRIVVPLDEISQDMKNAMVAIEDRRFYEHGGVDGRGLLRAVVATVGGDTQGASTLTQQYVRQLLVAAARQNENEDAAQAALARSGIAGGVRKIQEMKYAISMEQRRSKDQILEGYLNIVYFGAQAYGIEAAAHRYYDTTAAELNLAQSALIAGLAQNPGTADPINNPERAISRRNDVLDAMREEGMISTRRMREAKDQGLRLNVQPLQPSCPAATNPYVCEYVVKWLMEQESLGADPDERYKRLYHGGLEIHTTFDPALTARTSEILSDRISPTNPQRRGTAAAIVEPGTGRVLAIGQNTTWDMEGGPGKTSVNWAVDERYGASAGFQIGSTVKPFAVAAAIEDGLTAQSRVQTPKDGTTFTNRQLGGPECGIDSQPFSPYNVEGEEVGASTSLQNATVQSINTAFASLAERIGVCTVREVTNRMGLHRADGQPYGTGGLAATILGADNASPLTLAGAYATLASGGVYCEPYPVEKIVQFDGAELPVRKQQCDRAISPQVAYDTTRILERVMTEGTGRRSQLARGRVSAGKTGTADNSTETWFAGYTPQLAAAVWYGTPYDQRSVGAYGGTVAGPLWKRIIDEASSDMNRQRFRVFEEPPLLSEEQGADEGPSEDNTADENSSDSSD